MTKTRGRVLFAVVCVLAAAAVFQSFRIDRTRRHEQARLLTVERETGALLASFSDLRAAQMAYLATGQGPDFWMRRVTELSAFLEGGIGRLRSAVTVEAAAAGLDRASVGLRDLLQLDERARGAIESDQRFLASDIIFADSVGVSQQFIESLNSVRHTEYAGVDAVLQRDGYVQLALMPLAVLLVGAGAYLAGSRRQTSTPRSEAEVVAQMIRDLPPPVKAPSLQPSASVTPATPPVPKAPPPPPPTPLAPASTISWTDTAELCVDLARVMDARDMPSLLQRAARALDATGVVVWVVDTRGETLTPALAHGYSDRVLAKMGALPVGADNLTSLSFRSVRPQAVPGAGRDGSGSAIAVPLVTTGGCNGVLAAEVPGAKPAEECVAVARIIAAQLAAMLAPVEASTGKAAEA